jgi:biotin-dependent carboxylase-like uncharacterized protein
MLKVIMPGMQTLVEDWPGRPGYNGMGMGASGAMDPLALEMGNLLLHNDLSEAGVEIAAGFYSCSFEEDTVIAFTGADMSPSLNGEAIPMWQTVSVKAGDVFATEACKDGFRSYLCISGGIAVEPYLGSKSTCTFGSYGGFFGRAFTAGDEIPTGRSTFTGATRRIKQDQIPDYPVDIVLRAIPGMNAAPDFMTKSGMNYLFSHSFTVSITANRSAVRLEEIPVEFFARESGGIGGSHPSNIVDHAYNIRGGLNITGNTPSLLIADGPTLGGFICTLNVINADLWKVGQAIPGKSTFRFYEVSPEEAVQARRERRELLTESIIEEV